MNAFLPADILMPKTDHMEKWAVIACDQFTSDQAYWDRVRKNAEGAVSTINLILPEAELGTENDAEHTAESTATMTRMTIPRARPAPSARPSAPCRSASRPASVSAATRPSSCRTC